MESVSSTRGLETRRWSMFDREGEGVVNRIDISAHLLTSGFGVIARFPGDCSRHSKPGLQALVGFR
jgi:hypothetical protein